MKLIPANLAHSQFLLACRNDPLTRKASINQEEVSLDTHQKWLDDALNDKQLSLFVVEHDHELIGTVRAQHQQDGQFLSWTVAPSARGRGLGKAMVKALIESLSGKLYAQVRNDNHASIAIAKACEMQLLEESKGVMLFMCEK